MNLFNQPENRFGDDSQQTVIHGQSPGQVRLCQVVLQLGADEDAAVEILACTIGIVRLGQPDPVQSITVDDTCVVMIDLALCGNECAEEVMLNHRCPAVFYIAGQIGVAMSSNLIFSYFSSGL